MIGVVELCNRHHAQRSGVTKGSGKYKNRKQTNKNIYEE